MKDIDKKGKRHGKWLEKKIAAKCFWFASTYKHEHWSGSIHTTMIDINSIKSFNAGLKPESRFLLSIGRGMDVVKLVHLWQKVDSDDARNIILAVRLNYVRTAHWTRYPRKKKRDIDDLVVFRDKYISHLSKEIESKKTQSVIE